MNRPTPDQPAPTSTLCPEDAATLDALMGGGGLSSVGGAGTSRADRLAAVLALLDRYPAQNPSGTLRAELIGRIDAMRDAVANPVGLHDADAGVVEALLAARAQGAASGPMPPGSADRARAAASVLALLDRAPVDAPPTDLAGRTLRAIEHARDTQRLARLVDADRSAGSGFGGGWRIGLRQAASVAAVLVIGMSLLVPVLSQARHQAQQQDCRANLAQAGGGLTQYANDNRGMLPRQARPDDVFSELMRFAEDADGASLPSSAVHMLVLPREGYLREQQLTCPSGSPELVMGGLYSTQHVEGTRALRLSSFDGPLMADTNPLYELRNGRAVRLDGWDQSASKNHGQRGQNVLMADTSIRWTVVPVVQHNDLNDNFWTPDATPRSSRPADTRPPSAEDAEPYDAFLTP